MAGSYETLKDLDLSREEIERFGDALKKKEFRKLFAEYVEELQDPENKRIFQSEVTELERERGMDVTFINPIAGYVIKTSVDGSKKAFINVCSNENVEKPTSAPASVDGAKGLQWSLPHSLAPPREDVDNKKVRCNVYDVVFHPDTLHLAQNNSAFRTMVNKTACEAIENSFDVTLDTKNLKFPKLNYKGTPNPTIIRKPLDEKLPEKSPEEQEIMDKIYANIPKTESNQKPHTKKKSTRKSDDPSRYTTPKYVIKHRSHIELENFTYKKDAKINAATPKELVVEIMLPLLKSASEINLDVTEKTLQLTSEKPAKYKLNITLPYLVNQDGGNAKFEKDLKKLLVSLPVIRNHHSIDYSREDSGVESDHNISVTPPLVEKRETIITPPQFLDGNIQYSLPEYTCHLCDNITFTLNVKNVSENTLERVIIGESLHVKFCSMSAGYFPVYYSFYVKVPGVELEDVVVEAWDNNVVVQIGFKIAPVKYFIGVSESDVIEKVFDSNDDEQVESDDEGTEQEFEVVKVREVQKANVVLDTVALKDEPSGAIDIPCSESSGDELSCSYSPSRSKGILKRISSARSSVSRSISESSIDDLMWTSSFEYGYNSMDSVIPEDGEVSGSMKKTVRFSDNVTRQLFRSNSSILGQKKKNQRKARNKKRAQERRHSESELSESEEKREGDVKTQKEDNHIFALDMY